MVLSICLASLALFAFLKPRTNYHYSPSSTVQSKKKVALKKKRKQKDAKKDNKAHAKPVLDENLSDEDAENIPPEPEKPDNSSLDRRKSIELQLVPKLIDDELVEKHEPHLDQKPNKPILKNKNAVDNFTLDTSGIHYDHTITPKDEIEIFHKKISLTNSEVVEPDSPWSGLADQDSSDTIDTHFIHKAKSKKRKSKNSLSSLDADSKIEAHSQTEPVLDTKHIQAQVNELNSKINKLTKELKVSNDELHNSRKVNATLEQSHSSLKSREEDVSRTCHALQQELNQLLSRVKNAERDRDGAFMRLNTMEREMNDVQKEKSKTIQENQKLIQSVTQLNGKLGVINNISTENIGLKNRLEQTELELRNMQQASIVCKSGFVDKENKWKNEMSESSMRLSNVETRLQHCLHELDLERHRSDEYLKDINKLSDERCSQARTIESLKEQFAALTRDKIETQGRFQSQLNQANSQVALLTMELKTASEETERLRMAFEDVKTEQMVLVNMTESGRESENSSNNLVVVSAVPDEELDALKTQLEEKELAWTALETRLTAEANSAREKLATIEKSLKTSQDRLSRAQQDKQVAFAEMEKYKKALEVAEDHLDTIQSIAEPYEARLKILEAECEHLRKQLGMRTDKSVKAAATKKQVKMSVAGKVNGSCVGLDDTLEEGEVRDDLSFLDD